MDTYRKYTGNLSGSSHKRYEQVIHINLPLPHDGVGKALRSIFQASRDETPRDMLDLLMKLDRD